MTAKRDGVLPDAEDIANTVTWLVSDEAHFHDRGPTPTSTERASAIW